MSPVERFLLRTMAGVILENSGQASGATQRALANALRLFDEEAKTLVAPKATSEQEPVT